MAIEPINSMMTLQTQNIKVAETVKPVAGGMDAASLEQNHLVDTTVAPVQKVMDKGTETDANAQKDPNASNQAQQASKDQIKEAVEKMNKNMDNSEAVFGIHEGTNRITIKIVDKTSKKVIKELPPEKTLDMIAKVWEMAGILVDEKR